MPTIYRPGNHYAGDIENHKDETPVMNDWAEKYPQLINACRAAECGAGMRTQNPWSLS